jgi:hypothetical protein
MDRITFPDDRWIASPPPKDQYTEFSRSNPHLNSFHPNHLWRILRMHDTLRWVKGEPSSVGSPRGSRSGDPQDRG